MPTPASSSPQNPYLSLSPQRVGHDRNSSLSRPSSRASNSSRSFRAPSPSYSSKDLLEDPVAVRQQISTLKHTIRHQQAQVHVLENTILRGPRPYADLDSDRHTMAGVDLPPSSYATNAAKKVARRTSFDVLQGLAGPDSNLPLPSRRDVNGNEDGIREGIPMNFGVGALSPPSYKRMSSPTRTLSRIPVSSVGNARALADEGQPAQNKLSPLDIDASIASSSTSPSLQLSNLPPSPNGNRRLSSLTPGGTTKVLADLQTGVINARNALENTKAQLRLSQRSVAQLTRQTEDLKEGRERLRIENEGLNNVVARKERLLQEVLERARKAESDSASLKSQLKTDTSTAKKALREMESALAESTALSQKSEREYITLRDSLKAMTESWKQDTDRLRDEMRKREDRWKTEAENLGKKYRKLLQEIESSKESKETFKMLREEDMRAEKEVENSWLQEIEKLKQEIHKATQKGDEANATAIQVANELARLRRLMQNAGRATSPLPP
ncbi:hypothetical protein C8J56DRAFT_820792 [Mycena floridula]|nr:hypothetical protein C8J56DRAFT_820792 [Mycena floridula]